MFRIGVCYDNVSLERLDGLADLYKETVTNSVVSCAWLKTVLNNRLLWFSTVSVSLSTFPFFFFQHCKDRKKILEYEIPILKSCVWHFIKWFEIKHKLRFPMWYKLFLSLTFEKCKSKTALKRTTWKTTAHARLVRVTNSPNVHPADAVFLKSISRFSVPFL